jgi:thiol-disulfide isomerase/thioredoxin
LTNPRHGRLAPLALLLLALALPLAACAGPGPGTEGEAASGAATDAAGDSLELRPASAPEILEDVRRNDAKATVLNVWATWCGPCREEFPDLVRLYRTHADRGLDLVLVSADFDDQVPDARAFLADHGVDFLTYLKTGKDMEFIDSLNPEWGGALPATFVYDADGHLVEFWEGKATYEEMEQRTLPTLEGRDTRTP